MFVTPYFSPKLQRIPVSRSTALQAYCAADEYLIRSLYGLQPPEQGTVLVVNDEFGAMALSLAEKFNVTSYGDSHLSAMALQHNLHSNGFEKNKVHFTHSLNRPGHQPAFDVVLIRIPKTLTLLEQQLATLGHCINEKTIVLAGSMIKHLPRAAGDLLERYIGPIQASLAWKKARLLQAFPDHRQLPVPPLSSYVLEEYNLELINHPGVFCSKALDIGTRLLLEHLPASDTPVQAADLGCGNGVLGMAFVRRNPHADMLFIDESYNAIQSTQDSWQHNFSATNNMRIQLADGLSQEAPNSLDRILCNPPFHQQQAVTDSLALRMFKQAYRCLRANGELWIVANRHLSYHTKLKRWFEKVEQVAAHPKFVILKATKSSA